MYTEESKFKTDTIDTMCGYFSWSTTLVFSSFMLRYWSTECSVPLIARSFFSSTVTSLPTNSLKYEKNNCTHGRTKKNPVEIMGCRENSKKICKKLQIENMGENPLWKSSCRRNWELKVTIFMHEMRERRRWWALLGSLGLKLGTGACSTELKSNTKKKG